MPAYLIARITVHDWPRYREYMAMTPSIIARYGGRYLSRGGAVTTLEGPDETARVVLLEFPAVDDARAFYHSPAFEEARRFRGDAATVQMVVIDQGTAGEPM